MEKTRRKLFSTPSQTETKRERKKLFSTATTLNSKERIKLFGDKAVNIEASEERMFSEIPEGEFGMLLKEWEGKELDSQYATKIFSGVDLVSEGLAENTEDGKIRVFSMANEVEKLFSSLKVTVIKELCLDPIPEPNPASMIDSLGSSHALPTKTIVLLKKAHGLPKEVIESETEGWIKDSGIKQDLEHEFEDKNFEEKKLKDILEERYEDAPEGLIEILKTSGVLETTPEGNLRLKK